MAKSLREQIQTLTPERRQEWIDSLDNDLVLELKNKPWWFIGRPEQQEPEGDWNVWLILSGRGWGKTRTGSEWLVDSIIKQPLAPDGTPTQWAIVAPTFKDVRNICVDGPSGILKVLQRRGFVPDSDYIYNKSSWQIQFKDGQKIHMFGADDADAGRGLNLAGGWLDEVAMWQYPEATFIEGIAPALRIGLHPRIVVTTTPKPIKLLRDWTSRTDGSVYITRGSTFDNARNLSKTALQELKARYDGTRIGRQELYGELLEDVEGALWNLRMIEEARITPDALPPLIRVVTAIDPAVTSGEDSDYTGIVTVGMSGDQHFYVLDDVTVKTTPDQWARIAIDNYRKWRGDRIVAETNNGGDMVEHVLRTVDGTIPYNKVTASRGKRLRAEPAAALYEQNRVHHVGIFQELEDQMCNWTPESKESPDRLDALVWAIEELKENQTTQIALSAMAWFCPVCRFPMPRGARSCMKCGTSQIGAINGANL